MFTQAVILATALFSAFSTSEVSSERIYQFMITSTQFVKWNNEKDFGNVVISVINSNDLDKLVASRAKIASNRKRKIEYRKFSWESVADCHLIFVGKLSEDELSRLEKLAAEHQIVLISQEKNAFAAPSIYLFQDDNRLRYEINEMGFLNSGIEVGSTLKRIAARTAIVPN